MTKKCSKTFSHELGSKGSSATYHSTNVKGIFFGKDVRRRKKVFIASLFNGKPYL